MKEKNCVFAKIAFFKGRTRGKLCRKSRRKRKKADKEGENQAENIKNEQEKGPYK